MARFVLYVLSEKPNRNQSSWFGGSKASPFSCFNDTVSTWAGERIIYHKSLSDRYLAGSQHPRLCNNIQYEKFLRWNPDFVTLRLNSTSKHLTTSWYTDTKRQKSAFLHTLWGFIGYRHNKPNIYKPGGIFFLLLFQLH